MKRTLCFSLALLTLCAALSGCAPKQEQKPLTPEERSTLYRSAIEDARSAEDNEYCPVITALEEGDDYLLQMLGVSADDMNCYALAVSLMNVQAYGIAAIYPAAGRADAVLEGLQGFIDMQKQNFHQYLADQYDIASNARLETLDDGTLLLVMCEGQDAVFDAIRDSIHAGT